METKTKQEMKEISGGIAAEMHEDDIAVLRGDNGETGDKRVTVWEILTEQPDRFDVFVANTNGDPVWEEQDQQVWDELMESEGVTFYDDEEVSRG